MNWLQYDEYFKELNKEDKDRLMNIRDQKLIDINEELKSCCPALKYKEAQKIYGPIEKIMKKKLDQWAKSDINAEEEDAQQRFGFLKLMGFKIEIKQ